MSTYIKCKEVRHIEAQQIENLFAGNIRNLLMDAKLDYDKLYEIRLRVGRPLFLTYDGGECFLRKPGQEQYLVTTEDLKETLEYVTGYSLYAYEDEIRQGFISVQGGHRVGVTGEITLRGRVLPIGGLKEKLLAAKYAKIKEVLVPAENKPDIQELDKEITDGLTITFVSSMKEVLNRALV